MGKRLQLRCQLPNLPEEVPDQGHEVRLGDCCGGEAEAAQADPLQFCDKGVENGRSSISSSRGVHAGGLLLQHVG